MGRRSGFCFALSASLVLGSSGPAAAVHALDKDMASAPLQARQQEELHCTIINKSDSNFSVSMTLKTPSGAVVAGPANGLLTPDGRGEVRLTVPFGQVVSAYCHVELSSGHFAVGNLVVNDPQGRTRAEAPLQSDIHGKLDDLQATAEGLPMGVYRSTVTLPVIMPGASTTGSHSCSAEDHALAPRVDQSVDSANLAVDLVLRSAVPTGFDTISYTIFNAGTVASSASNTFVIWCLNFPAP